MTTRPDLNALRVGDELPELSLPAITRTTLALYCGASNDHHPMHVDIDFAREVGLGDVIGHGMLSMAYVGRYITELVPQCALRQLSCRFVDTTRVGDIPTLSARVVEKFSHEGEKRLRVSITLQNQDAQIKVRGEATISIE